MSKFGLFSRWDGIFNAFGLGGRKRKGIKSLKRRTYSFEPLECRTLLSVCVWDGGSTANSKWTTPENWVGNVAPQAGDDLRFAGVQRTATENDFTAGTSFHSIEFAASNFSLSGNSLTLTSGITVDTGVNGSAISLNAALSGSNTLSVANNTSLAISGVVSGSGSLTKTAAGTLVLIGQNTYSGDTTIDAGVLALADGASITSDTIVNGGELRLTDSAEIDGNLIVDEDGAVTFNGGTVTGDATIEGDVSLVASTVAHVDGIIYLQGGLSVSTTLSSGQTMICGGLVIQRDVALDGGTLDLSGGALEVDPYTGNGATLSGTLMNVGQIRAYGITPEYALSLYKTGTGTLTVLGTNTYTEGSTVMAGTLAFGEGATSVGGATVHGGTLELAEGAVIDGDLTVDSDSTVFFNGGGTITGNADIAGEVDFTSGIVSFGGTLSMTGGAGKTATLAAGTVVVDGLYIQRTLVLDGGTLDLGGGLIEMDYYNGGTGQLLSGTLQNVGELTLLYPGGSMPVAIVKTGSGTLILAGENTYTGGTTVSAGTLQIGDGVTDASLVGDILDNASLLFAVTSQQTLSGVISGSGSVTKTGAGALVLTGANTYSGGTTVEAGALVAGDPAVAPFVLASGNSAVNEGISYPLELTSTVTLTGWQVNWQDGHTDSLDGSATSTSHTYADGPASYQLTATATDGSSRTATVTLPLAVSNVAPQVALYGMAAVNEYAPYVLTLGAVVDPGQDTVQSYTIHWGDGQETTYSASQMASLGRQVSHTYTVAPVTRTITLDLTDEDGTYTDVASKNVTVGVTTPAMPTTFAVAAASSSQIDLKWEDNAGNETGYKIERSTDSYNWTQLTTTDVNATSYSDTELAEGTSYYYRVQATNSYGDSAYTSSIIATTLPAAPSNLSVTSIGGSQVSFSWQDNSSIENSFSIEQLVGNSWQQIGTASANATTATITSQTYNPATQYSFRVRAFSYTGYQNSLYCNVVTTTPAWPVAPTSFTVTAASSSQIDLKWEDNAGNETGYRIERSTDNQNWSLLATTAANATIYSDTGLTEGTSYYYRVQATNGDGDSAYSSSASATTLPAAPSNVSVTSITGSQVSLSWQDNSSIESYFSIEQFNGTSWQQIGTASANATDTTISNQTFNPSTQYSFRVRAFSYTGYQNSLPSNVVATTPAWPVAPTNLTVTAASSSQITLKWDDNAANETGYKIERSADNYNWTELTTTAANATSYSDTGLSEGTTYYYRVRATNANGDSAYSSSASATTLPVAPSNVSVISITGSQVSLSWQDNSSIESYFVIEQLTGTSWQQIGTASANATNTTISNQTYIASTQYGFRVRAFSYTGYQNSLPSNVALATTPAWPAAPTSLTATAASNTQINLIWEDNAGNETGYKIERSTDNYNWTELTTTSADATSYNNTGLSEGTTYYYRVRATNGNGDSAFTSSASATALPAAPSDLAVTVTSGQADFSWQDNSSIENYFSIEQLTAYGWQQIGTASANATSVTITNPSYSPSTQYTFRVRAYSYTGWQNSLPSNVVTVNATTPAMPTNLTATAASNTQINLTWEDNASNETGYKVERSTDNNNWTELTTTAANATSYSSTGLSEGTTYYYRIRATNGNGDSTYSNTANATTLPAAPSSLAITSMGGNQVSFSWQDNSSVENYFSVEQLVGASWQQIGTASANATSTTISNQTFNPSTQYSFRVRAFSYTGYQNSLPSSVAATTPAWPVAPTNLTVTAASSSQIDLKWDDNAANETGYKIECSTDNYNWTELTTTSADAISYNNTGLSEGTTYYYRVRATNGNGDSVYTSSVSATTLTAAPANLAVTSISGNQVSFTWQDNSSAENYYSIEQLVGNTWQQIGTASADATSTTISNQTYHPSTQYSFRLRAYSYAGSQYSQSSNVATTTPAWPVAPGSLTAATASDSQIDLKWEDNAGNETGYKIERSTDNQNWNLLTTTAANATSYSDTGLSEGATYYYRVRATNNYGDSTYTSSVSATTLPTSPSSLSVTSLNGSQVSLSWQDNSSIESYFVIEQLTGTSWQQIGTASANATSTTISNQTYNASTQYSFRVRAFSYTGYQNSLPSNVASATTPAWPVAPTNLTIAVASDSRINLAWEDNANNETGYKIERSPDGSNWTLLATTEADATAYSNTGLGEGTAYYYRLQATNNYGDSAYTSTVGGTTLPTAPSNLVVTSIGSSQVSLSWQDNSSIENSFSIEQLTSYGWQQIGTASANATSVTITGQTYDPAAQYRFRVRAYSYTGGQNSLPSSVATVDTTIPVPTNLTAAVVSDSQVNLSWEDNADNETGYKIEASDDQGSTWTQITVTGSNCTSWSVVNLTPDTTYWFRVRTQSGMGDSAYSNTAVVTTTVILPGTPTVATPAASGENPVADTSTTLSVLGADDEGESNLTYTWTVTTKPAGADDPTFSVNGTNDAKNTTVTFSQSGAYGFMVSIIDEDSLSTTSSTAVTVVQMLTSIEVTPATSSVGINSTQQITAAAYDQFGGLMAVQPMLSWNATAGAIGMTGYFMAPGSSAEVTITAASGGVSGQTVVTVENQTPTVATAASAAESTVAGSSTTLSVLGADDAGESNLTYTWTVTSKPQGASDPTFSLNGGDAKSTAVIFSHAGTYELTVTITDGEDLSTTSSVQVVVDQTLTSVVVSASSTDLNAGDTSQFSAVALDQFGREMAAQPTFSWSSTYYSINSATGFYTAPRDASFIDVVTATAEGTSVSGSLAVGVFNERPTVDMAATAEMISDTEATLTVMGADDGGESHLVYVWSVVLLSPDATTPAFSDNYSNDAKSTDVTFHSAGLYKFIVTISDEEGLTAVGTGGQSFANVVYVDVDQVLTTIVVTPVDPSMYAGATEQFTAIAYDQFDDEMIPQPDFAWTVTGAENAPLGTIDDTGYYTAPNVSTVNTVTAESEGVSGDVEVTVVNQAPTVAMAATGELEADGLTASLSVLGDDDADELNLTYTWSVISYPAGVSAPTFSVNGSNDASDTTATFTAIGEYHFKVRITDDGNLWADSYLDFTVTQVLTDITLNLLSPTVNTGGTQQFTATGYDQYEDEMTTQPTFTWSATTGSISDSGLYTAPNASLPARIAAESDGISVGTTVFVVSSSPTTTARLGDSWIEPLWEQSQGSPESGGTRSAHINQAIGNITVVVDGGHFSVVVNDGSYGTAPANHFVPTTVTDSDTGSVISSRTDYWTVGDVTYTAYEDSTHRLIIDYTDLGGGNWTYVETWTSSYTITTTATIDNDTTTYSTASGSFNYTFDAGGNASDSHYTCTVVGSATANAPASSQPEWTQTTGSSNTVMNDTATASGSRSGSGNSTWSYASTTPYSYGTVNGSATDSGGASLSYGYSLGYSWSSGSGWTASGSASNRTSGSSHYSYSGSGTDEEEDYSGCQAENGSDHAFYDYAMYYSLSSSSWQFTSGSGGSSGNGGTHYEYEGDGVYSSSDDGETMNGTFEESGHANTSYNYATTASASGSGWSETGSRTETENGESHYSYSGSGTYTDSDDGWSASGTLSESGGDDDSYGYTSHYQLDEDSAWQATSGSGGSEGSGYAHSSFSGDGTYWSSASGQTMSGTFQESGENNTSYDYSTEATCIAGVWSETGNRTETEDGESHYSYSGSGSYWDSGDGWSSSGTLSESGGDDDSYDYTSNYELNEDGDWEATDGSGGSEGSGETHWSYSGGGDYIYETDLGTIYGTFEESGSDNTSYNYSTDATCTDGEWTETGTGSETENGESHYSYAGSGSGTNGWSGWTVNGTVSEDGGNDDFYSYTTNYELDEDGCWVATDGSGGSSGSGSTHLGFTGDGSYSASGGGGSINGSFHQDQSDDTSYDYHTTATLADGEWSESGSGSVTDSGFAHNSYSGSGSYSRYVNGASMSGSLDETGQADESYSYTKHYNLDDDGNWQAASGSGGASGSGSTRSSYAGSGSGYFGPSGTSLSGSAQESGFDDSSYEFQTTATYSTIWGDWTETGTKTASASGSGDFSYSASGEYGVPNPNGPYYSWFSGSANATGSSNTAYSSTKEYDLDVFGQWQLTSGSGTALGYGSTDFDYTAGGSGSFYTPFSVYPYYDMRDGTLTASGGDHSSYQYSQDYLLAPDDRWLSGSGSGGASGSGGRSWSYSASGSYAPFGGSSGSIEFSGSDNASYSYQTSATAGHGLWTETGTASGSDDGGQSFSYSDSGSYANGTIQESGSGNSTYHFTEHRTLLPNGTWAAAGGTGTASGTTDEHWSYEGSGSYSYYATSGSFQESGYADRSSQYNISAVLNASGTWVKSGRANVQSDEGSDYSYSASYSSSTSESDGMGGSWHDSLDVSEDG